MDIPGELRAFFLYNPLSPPHHSSLTISLIYSLSRARFATNTYNNTKIGNREVKKAKSGEYAILLFLAPKNLLPCKLYPRLGVGTDRPIAIDDEVLFLTLCSLRSTFSARGIVFQWLFASD